MNKQRFFIAAVAAVGIAVIAYFSFYQHKKVKFDPAFKTYISAYTSGIISSEAAIRVQLTADVVNPEEVNTAVKKELFSFSPSIKGNAVWVDTRTIEFRPSGRMEAGTEYTATFYLGEVMKVPSNFSEFVFNFQIVTQSVEVIVNGLRPLSNQNFDHQMLLGSVNTADVADVEQVEKILTASQNDKTLPIRWQHQPDRMIHNFTVDSIVRGKDSSLVLLKWNGNPIAVDITGEQSVTVPALGDFSLTSAKVINEGSEQYLLLEFTDPLLEDQNLQGLITLNGKSDLRFKIEDNTIKVYTSNRESGTISLFVDAAVKNGMGKPLQAEVRWNVLFEDIKPAVRLVGKGVILPSSNGLMFPFEAVNLSAVDVRVVKVYEANVAQFLQVNTLEGESELIRVGRMVLNKKIDLATIKQTDFTRWNQFALDLSDLIKTEPGAVYRVRIGFRKSYSLYTCTELDTTLTAEQNEEEDEGNWDDLNQNESSSWDYADNYYNEDEEYSWIDRDNPCKKSYYTSSKFVSRNVLASDLGIIAKRGMDGSMFIAVTDIKTTSTESGVTLQIYNLQRQLLLTTQTGSDGTAAINLPQKPFLLIAKKGEQRGYLKLDDGSSLSLSSFDIAGEKVQKGVKGFIYGERGVWRPGDSIYLMFMLEDKQKTLPPSHPVVLELYNPRGQLAKRIVRTEAFNGFYSFHTNTEEDAPTGNWEAKVKVGNAVFSKILKVEMVMPNRLKIKFDFPKAYLTGNEKQSAKMEVNWLTGSIAGNLKANVEVNLAAAKTSFPKYSEFVFDDPTRTFSADKQVLFDDRIDNNGKAIVTADIKIENAAPGILQANFVTRVFEPGGNASTDRFTVPYHPYDVYTGVRTPKGDKARGMLLTDTNHIVQIVSVDKNGNPVQGKRKLEIEFYKVKWRWWWDKTNEDLSGYNSSSYNSILKRDTISTINGIANWNLRLNYPEWGRYLLKVTDVASGHSTGKAFYMDWPGWAGRAQNDQAGSATVLTFTSDKEKYNVGEEAVLAIPSGKNSRALISVESGTKVLKYYWMEGKEGQTLFKLPVTTDMSPNVFVHVTMLQPHNQTVNDLPIRMYGVIPILVEDRNTHLQPVIKMPDVLRPLERVNINVSEAQGRAMTYTVAVVDEGLLDLTRFKTPDPWSNFYAREALGVKTWDMFDYVMGAWGAQLERILGIGGDDELVKPKDGKKANRFAPVVKFLGPFHLNKGETKSQSFIMPQYVGAVRTMIIAGEDGAYGSAEKSTPVRKPLMVLATLPRVLGPDESVDLPVTVFAMEKNVKDVKVEISASDIFTIEGERIKSIHFNRTGDDVINFKLKVKTQLGVGKVKITAVSGKERAETNVELDVRIPNPRVVEVFDTILSTGQSWNTLYKAIGVSGTNSAMLEVSSVPPLNLGKRLEYLIHYPYGCVEQTTSSVFPQLFLSELLDLNKEKKALIENNIKAGIIRLKAFQLPSGGLSFWPGENEESEWAANYAGHFMIEAELKGYSLPIGFIDQWKKYQRNKATTWSALGGADALTQAYRLYTLALAKAPELGSMNRLRENKSISVTAKWSLAAAYQLAGQPEAANQIISNLPTEMKSFVDMAETFGSVERDESIVLEALSLMNKKEKAMPVAKKISAELCSKDWMSTQTTAYSLLAMSKFIGKTGSGDMNFTYQANGSSQNISTQSVIKQAEIKVRGTQSGNVQIKNNGKSVLYVRVISEGIPKADNIPSSQNGLEMKVAYKDLQGGNVDVTNMDQGTDFYAEVSVTNPGLQGERSDLVLSQIFPSGWEILNSRLDGGNNSAIISVPTYQDIRDDRVNTFFTLKTKETKTFRIYLNASYIGSFYLPAVSAEAMYDASINARAAGKWVNVVEESEAKRESAGK